MPNGDWRRYRPDGRPELDYDHDDHDDPKNHPHDEDGGHSHDWDWTKNPPRQPARLNVWDPIAGVAIATASIVGIIYVVGNDVTGIGAADDGLLAPLAAAFGKGLSMVFC